MSISGRSPVAAAGVSAPATQAPPPAGAANGAAVTMAPPPAGAASGAAVTMPAVVDLGAPLGVGELAAGEPLPTGGTRLTAGLNDTAPPAAVVAAGQAQGRQPARPQEPGPA